MTLLLLILLIIVLAGAGGVGAWGVPAYRSEWVGMAAVLIVLVLLAALFMPGGRLLRYDTPPSATVR